jgi:hypothetical protein
VFASEKEVAGLTRHGHSSHTNGGSAGSVLIDVLAAEELVSRVGGGQTGLADAVAAAEQVRLRAEAEAERIRIAAAADAERARSMLEGDVEKIRQEAEDYASDVRLAVDAYAARCRRDAEAEGGRIIDEARSEAREILEAAQAARRTSEEDARQAQERIAIETGALEARRSRAIRHLQEIAAAIANLEAATSVEALRSLPPAEAD